jgi:hypothetical protein
MLVHCGGGIHSSSGQSPCNTHIGLIRVVGISLEPPEMWKCCQMRIQAALREGGELGLLFYAGGPR